MQTNEITRAYRVAQGLSLRRFAKALNEKLVNTDVSFATISRWESDQRTYEPDMRLLFECLATYTDWRARWAADCLKAMWPDLAQSKTIIFNLKKPA